MLKLKQILLLMRILKTSALGILAEFGLDLSTAINMFLRQMLRERAIPFEIKDNVLNATTLAVVAEVDEMEKGPELSKTYKSVDDLMENLLKLI